MKLLKEYFELQAKIYEYFGYDEDWKVIPLNDRTDYHWWYDDETKEVHFSSKPFTVERVLEGSELYSASMHTQRFLPKWVYEGVDYTMICVDTHTDGNKFLMVFDNTKKLIDPSPELVKAFLKWAWSEIGK